MQVTLAINGYDDGASTGEVRRFLGDSLGPSDFRKNASRLAIELGTCDTGLIAQLDARLPDGTTAEQARAALTIAWEAAPALRPALEAFLGALASSGRSFDFNDCSVGNLVFAGTFLLCDRQFNAAVDAYCALLGLPPGMVEDVTDGTNAFLVAVAADGTVLGSEEAIVDATRRNRITDIFLIDRALTAAEDRELTSAGAAAAARVFAERQVAVRINPRLVERLRDADLIVYAPGTQHSSLFPSYLTPGLTDVIASNLKAVKLLVTNIQSDAEIAGASAVDIIERALYYLREKGSRPIPAPCLITHYIVNDPEQTESSSPYVPLGQIEALEDPRVVRIANYESGVSGRHDAGRILGPFIQSLLAPSTTQRVGVLLHHAPSAQAAAEITRRATADAGQLTADVHVYDDENDLRVALSAGQLDYVVLFEASGAYRSEDIATLLSHLTTGRLDAVWGSRRFWARQIRESIRARYQRNVPLRVVSHFGSHVLSLTCLALYGRYVSDTLSGVLAVRAADAAAIGVPLTDPRANQHLLARLLGRKADILEIPVQFSAARDGERRVTLGGGLKALGVLVAGNPRRSDPVASR